MTARHDHPFGPAPAASYAEIAALLDEWETLPYSDQRLPNAWIAARLGVTESTVRRKREAAETARTALP